MEVSGKYGKSGKNKENIGNRGNSEWNINLKGKKKKVTKINNSEYIYIFK